MAKRNEAWIRNVESTIFVLSNFNFVISIMCLGLKNCVFINILRVKKQIVTLENGSLGKQMDMECIFGSMVKISSNYDN